MESNYFDLTKKYLKESDADAAAVSVLDFKTQIFESFEIAGKELNYGKAEIFFDLASLTKPLTNSIISFKNHLSDNSELDLLLNHRAGLPSWGLLSKSHWKEQILSYEIKENNVLYSDFSALRFMLEAEKLLKKSYIDMTKEYLDPEVIFWKDLSTQKTVQNGYIKGRPNFKSVHDPNAYNLNEFTSHAGLFSTIDGLSKTLMTQFTELKILEQMNNREDNHRFYGGFDTVQGIEKTLAGAGCSQKTFGHLGFTGTSFWIDPVKERGVIILTNTTKYYWHHRRELSQYRRDIGSLTWK